MPIQNKSESYSQYFVYILQCSDGTLYTGITTDIERRVREHNGVKPGGAKYTKARRPVTLVYTVETADRASASREEYRIKQLSRSNKLALLSESHKNTRPFG